MSENRLKAVPYKQLENDRVIVTEWRFAPGAETGWHKHEYDYVVVPSLDGSLLLETPKGELTSQLKKQQSYFRPAGVEHNVINANDFEFSFVEIELRNP
ncbi:MAG TPA: cupin domain-containing protein [Thiolinea sp.]|jgi:quercetin dioxygenase-like cupin family protein|nr:cupin domain-containing protein [Thiolinea sp.]